MSCKARKVKKEPPIKHSSAKRQSPRLSVLFFCSCDMVYHKQEVRFLLLGCVHDATHIFVWIWGSNMAAFPVMVPDVFIL